ncbi:MAG TPA: hypothetical protein VF546_13340 [Pyrinomonadaceae bacterium]
MTSRAEQAQPTVAGVGEYGFGTALAPGATWIQPRWYAYEWDTPFAEVCRLAPKLVSLNRRGRRGRRGR